MIARGIRAGSRGAVLTLLLVIALSGCGMSPGAAGPTVTVTTTMTAPPIVPSAPTDSESPSPGADLSNFVFVACAAATQYAILSAIGDGVYFDQEISQAVRLNTSAYLDVLNEAAQMDGDTQGLTSEQAQVVAAVAADLADQATFVRQMKKTTDYYTWYDTWMSVVDDPANLDSVQALLEAAGLTTCPLYPYAADFGFN